MLSTDILELMTSNTHKIIRRMIDLGYSDEDIVLRLRRPIEVVQAVHKEIELEKTAKNHDTDDYDWGEQ